MTDLTRAGSSTDGHRHAGTITIADNPGGGTRITLPPTPEDQR